MWRAQRAGPAGAMPCAGSRLPLRGAVDGHADVFLGSDSSGRYLLLACGKNGWIDHGRLRLLPPQGGAAFTDAW
jgi:hypothetical protein